MANFLRDLALGGTSSFRTTPITDADGTIVATRAVPRPALVGELIILAFLLLAYDRIRSFSGTNAQIAFGHAVDVMGIERATHLDLELPFNLWLSSHHELAIVASMYYQTAHLTATLTVLAVCYIWFPVVYRPARNALLFINAVGMVVYWVFPTAPPRLVPGAGFIDTTVAVGVVNAVHNPSVNQFAAMPSLHLAWAVWTAVIAMMMTRGYVWQGVWMAYPVMTTLVVIGTGNHFLLDVVFGVGLALLSLRIFRPQQLETEFLAGGAVVTRSPTALSRS